MVIRQEHVVHHPRFLLVQSEAGKVRTREVLSKAVQPVLWPGTMDIWPGKGSFDAPEKFL